MGTTRVEQYGIEVHAQDTRNPQARMAQFQGEVAAKSSNNPDLRVTKVQVELLADPIPTVAGPCPCDSYDKASLDSLGPLNDPNLLHLAKCFEITRTDATTYRFTDHDQDIQVWNTVDQAFANFSPVKGMSATSIQRQSGIKPGNYDAFGVTGTLTFNDLINNLFEDATVTQIVVDWKHPFLGVLRCDTHTMKRINHDGEKWQVELVGPFGKLEQPIGDVYTRTCRFKLGDPKTCGVSFVGAFINEGLSPSAVDTLEPNRKFTAAATIPNVPGSGGTPFADPINGSSWFRFGNVTWLTGANAGLSMEVREWDDGTDEWELYLDMPAPITTSDTFDATPGCDHTLIHCDAFIDASQTVLGGKFQNRNRYGGFPFMPGPDVLVRGPAISIENTVFGIIGKLFDIVGFGGG